MARFNKTLASKDVTFKGATFIESADPLDISDYIDYIFESNLEYTSILRKSINSDSSIDILKSILLENGFNISKTSIEDGIELYRNIYLEEYLPTKVFSSLLESKVPISFKSDGKVIFINPEELSDAQFNFIYRYLHKKGYDLRGAADVKYVMLQRQKVGFSDDWKDVLEKMFGKKENK